MRRRRMFMVVALVAASVASLATVEIVVRLLRPEATRGAILEGLQRERDTWHRPDSLFHHVGDGIFALRFPAEREDDGVRRLLIVGDSFAMGHGVGKEGRFGTLLERRLAGRYEVDVLAASSYSPVIYRNILERALAMTRYDVAAVFVDQTDPGDEVIYRNDLLPGDDSREFDVARMRDRSALVQRAYDGIERGFSGWSGLWRRSATFNALRPPPSLLGVIPADSPHARYLELSLRRGRLIHEFNAPSDPRVVGTMESLLERHLDAIVAACAARDLPLILAANPWEYHVSSSPRVGRAYGGPFPIENRLERMLVERYAERPGVRVLPLTAAFRAHADPSRLFLDRPSHEIHWNRDGHALVARTLERELERTLPSPGG